MSCISKARVNSESVLTFAGSSLYFLQNKVIVCPLYTRGYPVLLPAARPDQTVNDEPVKDFNLFLFVNFISH